MKQILLSALLLSGMMGAVAQVKKEDLATKNTKSPGAETSVHQRQEPPLSKCLTNTIF